MIAFATLVAAASLGLAQPPHLGVDCPYTANLTTCGRIGIAVWLKRPALSVDAQLLGSRVQMHAGGLGGKGPKYWEGYAHIDRHRLGLPARWYGDKPVKFLLLRLNIRYPTASATGSVRIQLLPGWG